MIVYKITCNANGKGYIGKTKRSLHARWRAHCAKGSGCWAMKGAIKKYGENAFRKEILASGLTDEEAEIVERRMVHEHGTKAPGGYNLTEGGQGSAHKNPAHGRNISAAWQREDTRARHMAWRTPERLSEKANAFSAWKRQQKAWNAKKMEEALSLEPLAAARMLWYRATKNREHAIRAGQDAEKLAWLDRTRDKQIAKVWALANVPVPPASSWAITTHAYEKMKYKKVVRGMRTKFRPSGACATQEEDRA